MGYPNGVSLAVISGGTAFTAFGDDVPVQITVTPRFPKQGGGFLTRIIHAATGWVMTSDPDTFTAEAGTEVSFSVPHVDQAGFRDPAQNAYTGWYYEVKVVVGAARGRTKTAYTQTVSPVVGQALVDLDLVPEGQNGNPQSVAVPEVVSVNGMTGAVVVESADDGSIARLVQDGESATGTAISDMLAGATTAAVAPALSAESVAAKLDRTGAGDRAVALGNSQVAWADAFSLAERWVDLTSWFASGPVTAGSGTVYSTATDGTDGHVRHALDLGATENLAVTGTITAVGGGNTGDYLTVRLAKTVGGFNPADTIGVGFRGDGVPMSYVGTGIGGAGTTLHGATPLPGVWTYFLHADQGFVSVSLTSPDGLTTYKQRVARSVFNAGITYVLVTTDDRRGLAGHTVGPMSIRKANVSPRPALTGLKARELSTQTNGQSTRVILPPSFDSRKPAPVIISAHGNTQNQDHMSLSAQRSTLIRAFGDQGFIYASSHMHGNQWGAQAAVTDLVELWKYLRDRYPVGPLVILGESMGSLATMNAVHRGALPIAGVGIVDGVMNLGWQYQNGMGGDGTPDSVGINAAYGIAGDGSDYAAKTAGYDPALADPVSYRGVPLRFLASPDDTRVPKANHADVLYSRISAVYPETTSRVDTTGGHTVDGHFLASTWLDWFRSCVSTV